MLLVVRLRILLVVRLGIGRSGSAGWEPCVQGRGRSGVPPGCGAVWLLPEALAQQQLHPASQPQQTGTSKPPQSRTAGSQLGSQALCSTHPSEGAGAAAASPVLVLASRGMPPFFTATTSGSLRISCVMLCGVQQGGEASEAGQGRWNASGLWVWRHGHYRRRSGGGAAAAALSRCAPSGSGC